MGLFRVMKKGLRVSRWVGTDRIRGDAKTVKSIATNLFKSEDAEATKNLDFEACLKHYKMTEDDLKLRMQQAKKWILFCLGGSALAFIYMIYQFSAHEFIAGFVCFMIGALTLAYAFREHFNLFQMRQRKLGCTFSEWFSSLISRGSK